MMNRDISKLGYKRNSPYKNEPFLVIDSPQGVITMDDVDKTLIAKDLKNNETRVLQPNSGNHFFKGDKIMEIPVDNFNKLNNSNNIMLNKPTNKKLFDKAFMKAKLKMGGYSMPNEIMKAAVTDYAKKGGGFTIDSNSINDGNLPAFLQKAQTGRQMPAPYSNPAIYNNPHFQSRFPDGTDNMTPEEVYKKTMTFNRLRPVNTKHQQSNVENQNWNDMVDFNTYNKAANALYMASNANDPVSGAPRGVSWEDYNKAMYPGRVKPGPGMKVEDGLIQNDEAQQIINNKKGQYGGIVKAQEGFEMPIRDNMFFKKTFPNNSDYNLTPEEMFQRTKKYEYQRPVMMPDEDTKYTNQQWNQMADYNALARAQKNLYLAGNRNDPNGAPRGIDWETYDRYYGKVNSNQLPRVEDGINQNDQIQRTINSKKQEGGSVSTPTEQAESFESWVSSTLDNDDVFENLPPKVKAELEYFKGDDEAKSSLTESYVQKYAPDVYNFWKNTKVRETPNVEVRPEASMLDMGSEPNPDSNPIMESQYPKAKTGMNFGDYLNRAKYKHTLNSSPKNYTEGSLVTYQRGGVIKQGVVKHYNPQTGKITLY